jgi:hypothetical protein
MKRLVYNGTRFAFVETADTVPPPAGDMPRRPQKAAYGHRGLPYRLRDLKPITSGGNGYKPGKLVDLGPDQCRYDIRDGIMCGAKGYPYCEHHHAICHTGKFAWDSERSKRIAAGTEKLGWVP